MGKQWDLFCRVIDNFGDIGVSWRLARDLATRGEQVRLWLDDASALAWMAPSGIPPGIEIKPWHQATQAPLMLARACDVLVETFGCDLPEAFLSQMAAQAAGGHAPQWINLEYLSAEPYVERSHGLSSPQFSGPAAGLNKVFFYPGFTQRTGGLLREPGLLQAQAAFDPQAWLAAQGVADQATSGERLVSLFAYPNAPLPQLIAALADRPTLLLVCAGQVQADLQSLSLPATLRLHALPYLSQDDFDRLLWACDLNFVRGEDSFVRAQWAGKPFVWQIYSQDDGAHGPKLEAFMDLWLAQAPAELAAQWRAAWRRWNGLAPYSSAELLTLPPTDTGSSALAHARQWRENLASQPDLLSQLSAHLLKHSHKSS
ncbi:elongation factor P maturation arginine rhamnosyltransferase EarP [Paucibacter sp. KBW04]|uniref:elongation factor P maturation arginine rhamnosyltransferase EarP n=1 Tax=Paucibacter sp. KBW04 TaxID=2153361 RepID=UPI000F565097|nr:elongation factor P maturation arginine rhamnosyltransferase EarP [Paucibacter sp. KBW04]RQO55369.1 elongation factor P maturation arginine rhamnosyltransferase EarP [Paucibacter sp. KBW04]